MRVHFFVRTLDEKTGGGSHYNSIAYIRALTEAGHSVISHVLYDNPKNSFPQDIQPVVHKGLGLSFLGERAYLAQLLQKYEDDADVFFLYAVEFTWAGGLYRRSGGKKPVVVYMDAYLASMRLTHQKTWSLTWYQYKRLPWDKFIGLRDTAFVDRFLPCSPYIGEVYTHFGFPKNKFTVLPNIVPPPSIPEQNKKDPAVLTVMYIGRLIYDKGIDLLIDVLEQVPFKQWKLLIVGSGDMELLVKKKISQGLSAELVGWVPQQEVGKYYAMADIFVHPARWPDPAPRTIVDALYCGLPVVVPDTGGSAWIAGNAGVVFKTGNARSLKQSLLPLLESATARQKLAAQSAVQANRFTKSAVLQKLQSILQSAIRENAAKV